MSEREKRPPGDAEPPEPPERDERDERDDEDRDDVGELIDQLARAGGRIGLNETRLRWKMLRWRDRWREAGERGAQGANAPRVRHRRCARCRGLNRADVKTCVHCEARLPPAWMEWPARLGLRLPERLVTTSLVAALIVAVHLAVVIASQDVGIMSADIRVLVGHGANWPPLTLGGEPWRLATSVFLHGGLLHLAFNLFALSQVGPMVEATFGPPTTAFVFLATGVVGSLASALLGSPAVSIGASGAVLGLIGVAAGWGHRDGTSIGLGVRNFMLRWLLYIVVFGLLVPGIDNAAHLGGFAAGAAFGLALDPRWIRERGGTLAGAFGLLGFGGIIAAAVAALIGGFTVPIG